MPGATFAAGLKTNSKEPPLPFVSAPVSASLSEVAAARSKSNSPPPFQVREVAPSVANGEAPSGETMPPALSATVRFTVPEPESVASVLTVNAPPAAMLPLTRNVPALTVVAPV